MSDHDINWPKVILFGDSLTQRSFEPLHGLWGALLADRLQRVADVIPRGFSGYNSRFCKFLLPRIFSAKNVSDIGAFVILLGANDACQGSTQFVPLDEFYSNLVTMIGYLKSIGLNQEKIILMTPPPRCHASECKEVGRIVPVRGNKAVAEYAEVCCNVGLKCQVDVVNMYAEMMKDEDWPKYLIDGLHFSHAGSVKVYTLLWPHIAKRTAANEMIFSAWRAVDVLNPAKYFEKPC